MLQDCTPITHNHDGTRQLRVWAAANSLHANRCSERRVNIHISTLHISVGDKIQCVVCSLYRGDVLSSCEVGYSRAVDVANTDT